MDTLDHPWDCKEIKPVRPKGNQSWIFIGRTDAEAETLTLWPPDVKNWVIGKDPHAGKNWRQEGKGMTEDDIVGWYSWLDGHKFEQALGLVMDREAWRAIVMRSQRVGHDWVTEQNWCPRGGLLPSRFNSLARMKGFNLSSLLDWDTGEVVREEGKARRNLCWCDHQSLPSLLWWTFAANNASTEALSFSSNTVHYILSGMPE